VERVHGGAVTVSVLGTTMTGSAQEPLRAGDAVKIGLRPEDFDIAPAGSAPAGLASIDATVEVVEYQGREFAVEARSDAGKPLHVRTARHVEPGQRVTLTASQDRVLVFPAELAATAKSAPEFEAAAL
jgi:putative spermidine/putrescine transport system ATP-binding protein